MHHLRDKYEDSITDQIEKVRDECVHYVDEYFAEMKNRFKDYAGNLTSSLVTTGEFKLLMDAVRRDKKLLDDLQKDFIQFRQMFILKETYFQYIAELDRTQEKYNEYIEKKLMPEISLHKDPDFILNLKDTLGQNIYIENSLTSTKSKIGRPGPGTMNLAEISRIDEVPGLLKGIESFIRKSGSVNFLHFFQENSKVFHLASPSEDPSKPVLWEKSKLNISFDIPLFSSSLAIRPDCIMLAGGIDVVKNKSVPDIYILNQHDNSLLKTGEMNSPRNSFSLVFLKDKVYAIGGCNEKDGKLASCESVTS